MTRTPTLLALLASVAAVGCDAQLAPHPERDLDNKMQLIEEDGGTASSGTCATADYCADDLGFVDVYVSEVMPDPSGCTDDHGEWIEVVNDTDGTVDLNGAVVEDRGSGARGIVRDLPVLEPGQYAVIGRGPAESFCGPAIDGTYGSAVNLNNTGDGLYLLRPSDDGWIDLVISWPEVRAGVTFETSPMDGWAWLHAVDDMGAGELGTPGTGPEDAGYQRSLAQVREGDLRITEVMGNPTCPYDHCEWIEVSNTRGIAVDLTGLDLVDAGGNAGPLDAALPAHGALVFGRYDAAHHADSDVLPDAFYGNVGLNNSDEQLFLMDGERELFRTPVFPAFASGMSWQFDSWWGSDDLASWTEAEPTPWQ
jgi:hypothetical protein